MGCDRIGQGGMGAVDEATHVRLGQRVAIKVVLHAVAARPELAYRFEHEARAAARLRGPHSARVDDVDTSPEGLPYLVMEYLEGHSLRDELRKRGPLPVDEAVRFAREPCEGVDEAHQAGIVHRDLKPANLFLRVEGRRRIVKVVDFGIAKRSDAGQADYRTATSAPIGQSRCPASRLYGPAAKNQASSEASARANDCGTEQGGRGLEGGEPQSASGGNQSR
ncbi:MAG TPA: serine/threonine-protein kinase [Polyangiaceae bacterium]|nr:serine/threonine-protein kinase [Polyangiaceae bacterium]